MWKNKKLVISLGFVLVLILALTGVLIWFFSPGIHVIGTAAHLDAVKQCYYVDPDSGEILGHSMLTLKGYCIPFTGKFSGTVNLPEYPVEGDTSENMVSKTNGYLRIAYTGYWFAPGDDGNVHGHTDPGHWIFVKNAENIYGLANLGEDAVMVICADSEQEAMEKRQEAYRACWGIDPTNW